MKYLSSLFAVAAAMLFAIPAGVAAPIHLNATLSPSNEVPPAGSTGFGVANLDLDPVAQTLHVNVSFSGLTSGTTASHVHCCLPSPFATGVNVGVATTTPTFAGFPLGVTSGIYDSTLDLSQASSYNPAFITAQGSLLGAETALINGLLSGLTYLNVHTANFPGGEIRGFLVAVPEPETYALLLAGLSMLGFMVRRKHHIA